MRGLGRVLDAMASNSTTATMKLFGISLSEAMRAALPLVLVLVVIPPVFAGLVWLLSHWEQSQGAWTAVIIMMAVAVIVVMATGYVIGAGHTFPSNYVGDSDVLGTPANSSHKVVDDRSDLLDTGAVSEAHEVDTDIRGLPLHAMLVPCLHGVGKWLATAALVFAALLF